MKGKEMKKLLLTLSCLCLFAMGSSLARAEGGSEEGSGPRLGVEGGIDLAGFNGKDAQDVFASRLGFVAGAFADLPLTSSLALQPEILYEQKGGKYNGTAYQLNYVEIPVLLDVTFGIPVFNPGILLGPSFDTNVAGVANINQTDIGLIIGAQATFSKFLVSGRYEIGLTNVTSTQNVQNGTFTLLVGLSFI